MPLALRRLVPLLLLVFVGAWMPAAHAQTATLRGFVKDAGTGEALEGAAVVLRDADGRLSGAATDRDGYFIVPRTAPGGYGVTVSYLGYTPLRDTLYLAAGAFETRTFELRVSSVEGDEVVVEAQREGAADLGLAGLDVVRPADIERLPSPGLSPDLVTYLQAQPGVVSTGDRGGQLFVRGGTPSQNLVLIDGIPIYQPFHVIGFFSAFPADILASTDVYAGGFGARYGGRISSVIDVKARSGNNRRFAASASAGPFIVALRAEGPIVPGKASFLVSARESVIEPVAPRLLGRDLPYRFWDRFARLSTELGARTSASATLMQTYDRGNLSDLAAGRDTLAASDDAVVWKNRAYGARLLHLPEGVPVIAELTATFTRLDNAFGTRDAPERTSSIQTIGAGGSISYLLGTEEIEAGFAVRNVRLNYNLSGQFDNVAPGAEYLTEASVYLDAAIPVSPSFAIRPGIRGSAFRGKLTAEPRVRAFLRPGGAKARHQFTAAWGLYRQDIEGISDRRDAGDVFTAWVASGVGADVPRAMHTIAGYGFRAGPAFSFEVEGYLKNLSNLLVPEFTSVPQFSTRLQPADGEVLGADVKVEGLRGPLYGSLAYGVSRVRYRARGGAVPVWYGSDALTYAPPHDRTHQVTATGQVSALGFDLSVQWSFGSGLPFTRSAGFDNFVLLDSLVDVRREPGVARVLYGRPYDARLPAYHRFDVSLDRAIRLPGRTELTLQAGLTNAYDRRNLFYLDLFTLRRIDQLPLIPSVGVKLSTR